MEAAAIIVPLLAAPTAAGKTAAALRLAERAEGRGLEVINADAMLVYQGMDIGTAKPSTEERQRVPHHLIDIVDPAADQTFSVVAWTEAAEAAIAEVLARGAKPLVVGGTGFYLAALRDGLPTTPTADPAVRAALEAELVERGLAPLSAELQAAAPQDARASQGNPRRVLRALEVLRASGRPPSAYPRRPPRFATRSFVALPTVAALAPRVSARARSMVENGLVEEVRGLLQRVPPAATAWQAIGYKEIARALRGEVGLEQAIGEVEAATLRYAKRQHTWFRHRPPDAERVYGVLDDLDDALSRWWGLG